MNIFINISGVYEEEGQILPGATTVDLKELPGTCCYCDSEAESAIRQAISPLPLAAVHWIDTGDYHYISKLWMEKIDVPFVLALFDNHPDDQQTAFGGLLSCGSWVQAAREGLPLMMADYLNSASIPDDLPVYLSVDLDILDRQYARTDWDQGRKSLDELITDIKQIAVRHRIMGADICGGITVTKGAVPEDLRINRTTRQRLGNILSSLIH